MADMKAETMISKGLVSADMAALLRGSRAQGHENALAALDQALATRESSRTSGEPKGTFAPVDRSVFQGIYDATLNAYRQNGGDGASAIRAGASYGQTITAQDDTGMLTNVGNQVKHALHFFFGHKARCPVSRLYSATTAKRPAGI